MYLPGKNVYLTPPPVGFPAWPDFRLAFPSFRGVRRGVSGLGDCMSADAIRAALGGPQNCDPKDTGCVLGNQQLDAAVNNLVDGGCIAPGATLSFTPNTSQAAIDAFQNNTPLEPNVSVNGVHDSGTPVYVPNQYGTLAATAAGSVPVGVTPSYLPVGTAPDGTKLGVALPNGSFTPSLPTGYTTPAPSTATSPSAAPAATTSSNSVANAPGGSPAVAPSTDASTLFGFPMWAVLGAGGLAIFLFARGK